MATNSYRALDPVWDIVASSDAASTIDGDTWNAAYYL